MIAVYAIFGVLIICIITFFMVTLNKKLKKPIYEGDNNKIPRIYTGCYRSAARNMLSNNSSHHPSHQQRLVDEELITYQYLNGVKNGTDN